jgi:RNA polymerase binding protein RbpA
MRGHHAGASGDGPGAEHDRPERSTAWAASHLVSFWCPDRHETTVRLAADVRVPPSWECANCGAPAGPDRAMPPLPEPDRHGRSHLDQLLLRRTPEEGARALAEALDRLHAMRAAQASPDRHVRPRRGEE